MSDVLPQLALIVVLVAINAAFAGTELALVSLRDGQLQRLEAQSTTGAVLARLARQPNQFLATIQIGITLAGFLASAAAAVSLAVPLENQLEFLGRAAAPVSVILVTLMLSYLTLVFGELAPKRLALQKAERWGMVMARPLDALSRLTRPVVWLLSRSTDLVVRILGGDPTLQREEVTEEELRDMVALQATFTPEQRRVIDGAFEIADRVLAEVMVPRGDVFMIDAEISSEEGLKLLKDSGHSRAPIAVGRNLDRASGVIHLRQLIDRPGATVGELASALTAFPDVVHVLTAMRELQRQRKQLAVVIDERGVAVGIVTMEDLVEELVGEIWDETDPDLATVRYEADGAIVLPGSFPFHDLVDIHVELPDGDFTTIAGFVLHCVGRIPTSGDSFTVADWHITVRSVLRHRITEVALKRDGQPASE